MNSLEKAKKLYNSCKSLSSYKDDFQIQINDSEEAYQIQEDFIKIKKLDLADSIGGWKVALTNPVMQKLVGVDTPAEGAIMKSLIYSNNDYLNFNNYLHLGSEAEIAIRVVKTFPKEVKKFNDMNEIKLSALKTEQKYSKNTFIYDFLSSMRQKINDPLGVRKKPKIK